MYQRTLGITVVAVSLVLAYTVVNESNAKLQFAAKLAPAPVRNRVLVISGHWGTKVDMRVVAEDLGLELTEASWLSKTLSITKFEAVDVWNRMGQMYCKSYEFIVIIDTVPAGGWPFMEGLHNASNCNAQRIMFLITNRFDFGVENDPEYRQAVQDAVGNPLFSFVQNNPYEEWYMAKRGIHAPPLLTIRPTGVIPAALLRDYAQAAVSSPELPAVLNYPAWAGSLMTREMARAGIKYQLLQRKQYGGPAGLAKFKAFVHLPYQVSVMSLYENLAAGIVYLVPSVGLLSSWCNSLGVSYPEDTSNAPRCRDADFAWNKTEFYGSTFSRFILKFDDLADLQHQLSTVDFGRIGEEAKIFMHEQRAETLSAWRGLLWN